VRVLAELERALDERGFASVAEAVGYAHRTPDRVSTRLTAAATG
jgi:hypothetical protein